MNARDDLAASIAFDADWEEPEGRQPCPKCGALMDAWNICEVCEPERYPELEATRTSAQRFFAEFKRITRHLIRSSP